MQVFTQLNHNPNLSLALGYFDGVHKGHQAVIKSAVEFARLNGYKSAVITFKDHPCCFFYGVCPKYILSREDRIKYIEDLGVDYLYMLDFEQISRLSADEYLQNVLVKYFEPKSITTGFNHFFGCKKSGDTVLLEKKQKFYNYKYFKINPQLIDTEPISSTLIRKLLNEGEIERANQMLVKPFSISGIVVKGNQIGRTIGFRTANINYPSELIDIPFGVFAVDVTFDNFQIPFNASVERKRCKGIANFGVKPTILGDNKPVLEVHILDFDEDIYGEKITVSFEKMIRVEKKFASLDELKKQIKIDINKI